MSWISKLICTIHPKDNWELCIMFGSLCLTKQLMGFELGVIHKVRTLRFRNFRPPPHCTCRYAFSLHLLLPLARTYRYFIKKIWQIYFVNYFQSKNHKQRYKIRNYKAIRKCQIKTPRKTVGSILCFLTVWERWEWIILDVWIAHFPLFLFCKEPAKK